MNWNEMTIPKYGNMFTNIYWVNQTAKEDIQYLLYRLGDSDLLKMTYDCVLGSGNEVLSDDQNYRIRQTFTTLGYPNITEMSFNRNALINDIKNNRPVFISGYAIKITNIHTTGWWIFKKTHTNESFDDGHAWILDGYVNREQQVTYHYVDCDTHERYNIESKNTLELVHNNFGWGGFFADGSGDHLAPGNKEGTGWYHVGVFNSNVGKQAESNQYKSGTEGNYQFNLKIITNIQ